MEVNYSVKKDDQTNKIFAIITIPKQGSLPGFETVSVGQYVTIKGAGGDEYARINEINDNEITASVKGKNVLLYKNIKKTGGRRKTRKSRKNKSRRYRRV